MAKLLKEITIIDVVSGRKALKCETTTYKSYKAIALALKDKEEVIVAVCEYLSGEKDPMKILAGYGHVSREGNTMTYPRRLDHDY